MVSFISSSYRNALGFSNEMIKAADPNKNKKYSKNVEKWCRYEYFYSSMDK